MLGPAQSSAPLAVVGIGQQPNPQPVSETAVQPMQPDIQPETAPPEQASATCSALSAFQDIEYSYAVGTPLPCCVHSVLPVVLYVALWYRW